jgi:hypothetical protein
MPTILEIDLAGDLIIREKRHVFTGSDSGGFNVAGNWQNSGIYNHAYGTVVFASGSSGRTIAPGGSAFYMLDFNNAAGGWTFDGNATTTNDFKITSGAVTAPSGILAVSASFQNAGVFDANGGTVLLNSGAPGETIDPGASAFHNLRIDNPSGGWTIAGNATTTGDFILANLGALAFSPGAVITVGGQFANHAGGAATDWTGSTLKLESGTSYTINTKTAGAGSYAALSLGPNTRIRMWDSTSTVYNLGPAASLYSMDHNGADGSLYIFGDYHVTGTDHWSITRPILTAPTWPARPVP